MALDFQTSTVLQYSSLQLCGTETELGRDFDLSGHTIGSRYHSMTCVGGRSTKCAVQCRQCQEQLSLCKHTIDNGERMNMHRERRLMGPNIQMCLKKYMCK